MAVIPSVMIFWGGSSWSVRSRKLAANGMKKKLAKMTP
jgi:hypothetical protein